MSRIVDSDLVAEEIRAEIKTGNPVIVNCDDGVFGVVIPADQYHFLIDLKAKYVDSPALGIGFRG